MASKVSDEDDRRSKRCRGGGGQSVEGVDENKSGYCVTAGGEKSVGVMEKWVGQPRQFFQCAKVSPILFD